MERLERFCRCSFFSSILFCTSLGRAVFFVFLLLRDVSSQTNACRVMKDHSKQNSHFSAFRATFFTNWAR
jgi:hypothetical protein